MINLSMMSEWFATLVNELFAGKSDSSDTGTSPSMEARIFGAETQESN